jgi:hypothetical protein
MLWFKWTHKSPQLRAAGPFDGPGTDTTPRKEVRASASGGQSDQRRRSIKIRSTYQNSSMTEANSAKAAATCWLVR